MSRLGVDRYEIREMGHSTPCWVWSGPLTNRGYGQIKLDQRTCKRSHRVMYEREVGPIPAGLTLDHLCRVRACINPEHLEPVTIAENVRRGDSAKLNFEKVREIRASSESQRVLAARFGVSQPLISKVQRGHIWQEGLIT